LAQGGSLPAAHPESRTGTHFVFLSIADVWAPPAGPRHFLFPPAEITPEIAPARFPPPLFNSFLIRLLLAPIRPPHLPLRFPSVNFAKAPPGSMQKDAGSRGSRPPLVTIPVRSRLPSTSIQYRSFYFALAHITDTFLSSISCDFDQSTHDRRNCPMGQLQ
jgi:hypothetical protein